MKRRLRAPFQIAGQRKNGNLWIAKAAARDMRHVPVEDALNVVLMDVRMPRSMGSRRHQILGEATVKTHVRHLLSKLGLGDRVRAVVLAYESGLIAPERAREVRQDHEEPAVRASPLEPLERRTIFLVPG